MERRGTIGGFLGEMHVKAGAGIGGGELLLIDNDLVMPQNLGRRRLGFNYLFNPKAQALADELKIVMPSVRLRGFNNDTKDVNLTCLDLIVNATDEESFGHWLVESSSCATSYVWIEGGRLSHLSKDTGHLAE